jgi:hypothetical protein
MLEIVGAFGADLTVDLTPKKGEPDSQADT